MPAAQQQQHEPPHHHHHQLEHGTPSTLGKRGSGALALARAARALFFFQHEFSRLEQHGQRRRLAKNSVLDSAKPRQDFSTLTHTLSCCTSNRQHSPAESVFPGGFLLFFQNGSELPFALSRSATKLAARSCLLHSAAVAGPLVPHLTASLICERHRRSQTQILGTSKNAP